MKLLIILSLLTSCASMTEAEQAKYNNDEAVRIMRETPATFRN